MDSTSILLDPQIKTHVLLPITLIMLLVYVLRQMATSLLKPKQQLQKMSKLRESQHSQYITMSGSNSWTSLCKSEWDAKKTSISEQYLKRSNLNKILENPIDDEKKINGKSTSNNNEVKNPLTEASFTDTLWQGIKANLLNYLPQPILMFYMSFLFRGYIVLKLPFTLTSNFKPMFQSSIMTSELDVSYVTGISWYFVNLLGVESLSKIFVPIFGISSIFDKPEQTILENISSIVTTGINPGHLNNQPQGRMSQPNVEEIFKKKTEGLKMANFRTCLTNVEERILRKNESI